MFEGSTDDKIKTIEILIAEVYKANQNPILFAMLKRYLSNFKSNSPQHTFVKLYVKMSYEMKEFDNILNVIENVSNGTLLVEESERHGVIQCVVKYCWTVAMNDYAAKAFERLLFLRVCNKYGEGKLKIASYKTIFLQLYSNLDFERQDDARLYNDLRAEYKDLEEANEIAGDDESFKSLLDMCTLKSCIIYRDPSIYSQTFELLNELKNMGKHELIMEIAAMKWDVGDRNSWNVVDQCIEHLYMNADNAMKWKSLMLAVKFSLKISNCERKGRELGLTRLGLVLDKIEVLIENEIDALKNNDQFQIPLNKSIEWMIINVWNIATKVSHDIDMSMSEVKFLFEGCIKLAKHLSEEQHSFKDKLHTAYGHVLEKIDTSENVI
ncbi:MAG: hypothetical protein MHMPM18_001199 [Marteilia pararefringens]